MFFSATGGGGETGRPQTRKGRGKRDDFKGRQKPPPPLTYRFTAGYTNGVVKIKNPLFSFSCSRSLGNISFKRSRRTNIAEKTPVVPDAKSLAQLSWRHMYQKAVALWHALSSAEKQDWESLARPKHMTGFAWFMSQCLKPNPGIYLPLQGGTMQGNIDMAKHRLLKLPLPTANQEAASKKYHDDNLPVGAYTEGARVYHDVNQSIPHATWTYLAFNSERYDTDNIHWPLINNSRLNCRTAGKYLIAFNGLFIDNAVGWRHCSIWLNGVTNIAYFSDDMGGTGLFRPALSTIYDLSVTDYVEVRVYQTSGAPLNFISIANSSPEFMIQRSG